MPSGDDDQIPAFLRKQGGAPAPQPKQQTEPTDDEIESEGEGFAERRDLVLDAELPNVGAWVDGVAPTSDRVLFPGDRGELRGETRRALVALLAGPSVDGERQPKLWLVLKRDEAVLRSRLSDLFLELAVDDENRIAFVRQVPPHGEAEIPILLRRQPLTFLQSAGLLILRAALTNASTVGQRAVIGGDELIADLGAYQDPANTDKAKFARQCAAVVETLKKVSILRPIPSSADRFEVSPTLALLLPAEQLEALRTTYEQLRDERTAARGTE